MTDPAARGYARWVLAAVLASVGPLAPRPAEAAPDAAKLLAEGKVAEACALLAEGVAADPSPAKELALGRCQEKLGTLATAMRTYQRVARAGSAGYKLAATAALRALEKKVPRLLVSVPGPAELPELAIELDGAPLDKAAWSRPEPVDPGEHTVTVHAPEYKPWRRTVTADKGTVTVEVPVLEEDRVAVAAQGTQLTLLRTIGGATWSDGVGFVVQAPPPQGVPVPPPPLVPVMRDDDLSRVSVGLDVGATSLNGAIQGVGPRSDFFVRPEFRKRSAWVVPWFDLHVSGGYLPSPQIGFFGGSGHVGVDVHPLRWTWLGVGPSFGYGGLVFVGGGNTIGDSGPEIGILNVHFRTRESQEERAIFEASFHLDERLSLGTDSIPSTASTFAGLRLGVGGRVRFRAFVEGRLAPGSDGATSYRASEQVFGGIGVGTAE